MKIQELLWMPVLNETTDLEELAQFIQESEMSNTSVFWAGVNAQNRVVLKTHVNQIDDANFLWVAAVWLDAIPFMVIAKYDRKVIRRFVFNEAVFWAAMAYLASLKQHPRLEKVAITSDLPTEICKLIQRR